MFCQMWLSLSFPKLFGDVCIRFWNSNAVAYLHSGVILKTLGHNLGFFFVCICVHVWWDSQGCINVKKGVLHWDGKSRCLVGDQCHQTVDVSPIFIFVLILVEWLISESYLRSCLFFITAYLSKLSKWQDCKWHVIFSFDIVWVPFLQKRS